MTFHQPSSVEDAVAALVALAQIQENGDWQEQVAIEQSPIQNWTFQWVREHDAEKTPSLVRLLFKIILKHIQAIASEKMSVTQRKKALERLTPLMQSVDEVATRLDRISQLFASAQAGLATQLEEYQQLQEFYSLLKKKPVTASIESPPHTQPVEAPDIEKMSEVQRIWADLDYELCFMKRDDGTSYLSDSLREHTELAADFSIDLESVTGDDPFVWSLNWKDQMLHKRARSILKGVWQEAHAFYQARSEERSGDLSRALSCALIALMMASKPSNLLMESSKKPVYRYFEDFQFFLRQALATRDYQILLTQSSSVAELALAHALCVCLFSDPWIGGEAVTVARRLIEDEQLPMDRAPMTLCEELRSRYESLTLALSRYPNGPLFKMLDLIREEKLPPFDVLIGGNLPGELQKIQFDHHTTSLLRMPAPVKQSVLTRPVICDEFLNFIHSTDQSKACGGHLVINLQSRHDWRERSRTFAFERLQEHVELRHCLTVVTFDYHSSFYWQAQEIEQMSTELFVSNFESALCDASGDYYFPDFVRQALVPNFSSGAMHAIRQLFFAGTPELNVVDRQIFIDLFHVLLTIKLLDLYRPGDMCYVCKDGVDQSMAAHALLMAIFWLLRQESIGSDRRSMLEGWLEGPALLIRERAMQPHVYERVVRALETVERGIAHLSQSGHSHRLNEELEPLYHANWWRMN